MSSAEPHKDPRHLARQLGEAARLGHAHADALAVLAAELERCERERRNAVGSYDRLVFEFEHAFRDKTEIVLTWDNLQALIARAGRAKP